MKIAGADPGLNQLAITIIEYADEKREHSETFFFKVPTFKQRKGNLKQSSVVVKKLKYVFDHALGVFQEWMPDIISIEDYQIIPGKGKHAVKSAMATAQVISACFAVGKMPLLYSSLELRPMILGRQKGSKEEMWEAVKGRFDGIALPSVAATHEEHIKDSVVLAEAGLQEYLENMKFLNFEE